MSGGNNSVGARGVRPSRYFRLDIVKISVCVWLYALVFVDGQGDKTGAIAKTRWGLLRGVWSQTRDGRLMKSFLGIPYALPPVGDLRFKSPQPWNRTWDGFRNATTEGNICIQMKDDYGITGHEDCLNLNVFVPVISDAKKDNSKIPVLVFVHGGGYMYGCNAKIIYGPEYLLDRDIILVTLNYRVNVFGFFSTGNKVSPGNYGLKDIVMALRWIKKNIKNFNGDADAVTLMGHSAGAAAVHLISLSRNTEGLFHRYVMLSGSAIAPWSLHPTETYRQTCLKAASLVGCLPTANTLNQTSRHSEKKPGRGNTGGEKLNRILNADEEMMQCMRTVDSELLKNIYHKYTVWQKHPVFIFGPVIEEDSADAILTTNPIKLLKNGLFRDIPAMMGIVMDEGLLASIDLYMHKTMKDDFLRTFARHLTYFLEYNEVISDEKTFATAIENFYFNENVMSTDLNSITNLAGDAQLTWPLFQAMEYKSKLGKSITYFSLFAYEGTFSVTFFSGSTKRYGVTHGDDTLYLFPVSSILEHDTKLKHTKNDNTTIKMMTELLANFVIKGEPTAATVPKWPDYRNNHEFLKIGSGKSTAVTVEKDFLTDRMKFWEQFLPNITTVYDLQYAWFKNHNQRGMFRFR